MLYLILQQEAKPGPGAKPSGDNLKSNLKGGPIAARGPDAPGKVKPPPSAQAGISESQAGILKGPRGASASGSRF